MIYVGLTSRQLQRRVREHVLGIIAAHNKSDPTLLKALPRNFKEKQDCLRVRGIDREIVGPRGGNWKRTLAQRETKWIHIDTLHPRGLNDNMSFTPFL